MNGKVSMCFGQAECPGYAEAIQRSGLQQQQSIHHKWLDVMLMFDLVFLQVYDRSGRSGMLSHPNSLVRQKREWTVPPAFIREEEDNSYRNPIARVSLEKR